VQQGQEPRWADGCRLVADGRIRPAVAATSRGGRRGDGSQGRRGFRRHLYNRVPLELRSLQPARPYHSSAVQRRVGGPPLPVEARQNHIVEARLWTRSFAAAGSLRRCRRNPSALGADFGVAGRERQRRGVSARDDATSGRHTPASGRKLCGPTRGQADALHPPV